jgi:hypothetical protein
VIAEKNGGIWCDAAQHLIQKGGEYVRIEGGGTACPEHNMGPLPAVKMQEAMAK